MVLGVRVGPRLLAEFGNDRRLHWYVGGSHFESNEGVVNIRIQEGRTEVIGPRFFGPRHAASVQRYQHQPDAGIRYHPKP